MSVGKCVKNSENDVSGVRDAPKRFRKTVIFEIMAIIRDQQSEYAFGNSYHIIFKYLAYEECTSVSQFDPRMTGHTCLQSTRMVTGFRMGLTNRTGQLHPSFTQKLFFYRHVSRDNVSHMVLIIIIVCICYHIITKTNVCYLIALDLKLHSNTFNTFMRL